MVIIRICQGDGALVWIGERKLLSSFIWMDHLSPKGTFVYRMIFASASRMGLPTQESNRASNRAHMSFPIVRTKRETPDGSPYRTVQSCSPDVTERLDLRVNWTPVSSVSAPKFLEHSKYSGVVDAGWCIGDGDEADTIWWTG